MNMGCTRNKSFYYIAKHDGKIIKNDRNTIKLLFFLTWST